MDHGKRWSFVKYKCRCEACVAANDAYMGAYRARNKEQILAKEKERYQRDKDRIVANAREYYERESAAIAEKRKGPEGLHKRARTEADRRARMRGAFVESVDRREVWKRDRPFCGICGEVMTWREVTLDHIVPLSRGGLHCYANVQIAHKLCNEKKQARMPIGDELERVVYRTVSL